MKLPSSFFSKILVNCCSINSPENRAGSFFPRNPLRELKKHATAPAFGTKRYFSAIQSSYVKSPVLHETEVWIGKNVFDRFSTSYIEKYTLGRYFIEYFIGGSPLGTPCPVCWTIIFGDLNTSDQISLVIYDYDIHTAYMPSKVI